MQLFQTGSIHVEARNATDIRIPNYVTTLQNVLDDMMPVRLVDRRSNGTSVPIDKAKQL